MKRVLALILIFFIVGCSNEYSTGERAGTVYKLSKKGYFLKTWEGELNVGGVATDNVGIMVPNVWQFSICDESYVKAVSDALETGKRVKVGYSEKVWQMPWDGMTDYCIVSVK